jgi:hypothetical protein
VRKRKKKWRKWLTRQDKATKGKFDISEIPTQHDYLVFQSNKNLPPVFPKGQLNLLYEVKQKDSFILQKFQTPATISLSSISENCKKPNAFFSGNYIVVPEYKVSNLTLYS